MQPIKQLFYLIFVYLLQCHSIASNAFVSVNLSAFSNNHRSSSRSTIMVSSSALGSSKQSCSGTTSEAKPKKRALYSFVEARRIARGHGFASQQEFLDYDCAGAYQLPKNADEVWSRDWTSWDDFLGIPLEFSEAREIAREKVGPNSEWKVSTEAQYLELMKQKVFEDGDIASRLPYRPDLKYKTKGWVSWDDFLQLNSII